MSIRRKLLFLFLIVAGIPVLSVSVYNHFQSLDKVANSLRAELRSDLKQTDLGFAEVIHEALDEIDLLSWNYELHALLSRWYARRTIRNFSPHELSADFEAGLANLLSERLELSRLTYLSIAYYDSAGFLLMARNFRENEQTGQFGGGAETDTGNSLGKLYLPDPFKRTQFQTLSQADSSLAVIDATTDALTIAALILDEDEVDYIGMAVVQYSLPAILALGGFQEPRALHAINVALNQRSGDLLLEIGRGEYALSAVNLNQIRDAIGTGIASHETLSASVATNAESPLDVVLTTDLTLDGLHGTWALALSSYPHFGINIGMLRNITESTRTWRDASFTSMLALLSILAISAILIGLVVARITHSIQAVSEAAQEIAGGNLDHDINVDSRDELRGLADSFNSMSVSLRQTMSNLEDLNQTLESRVRDRTRDLESANRLIEEQKLELEEELVKAHDMQMRLMPETAPKVAGFDLAGQCRPATHVGGDFFQYFTLPDGRISFVVADVTGHGMEAAIPTMVFSGLLGNQIAYSNSPQHLYTKLNQSLFNLLERRTFICFAMGELDINRGRLRVCNSGCPYPYHFRHASSTVSEICLDAFPLGLRENSSYEIHETVLASNDRIVLCSDGIIEASNETGEIFGFDRTSEAIRVACKTNLQAGEVIQHVFDSVNRFSQRAEQDDDQTIVVLHATY